MQRCTNIIGMRLLLGLIQTNKLYVLLKQGAIEFLFFFSYKLELMYSNIYMIWIKAELREETIDNTILARELNSSDKTDL